MLFVLTVPMRNGNALCQGPLATLYRKVLTVPMRNGNSEQTGGMLVGLMNSSYRTYEEWKRYGAISVSDETLGSYRTYEEWKHVDNNKPIVP